MNTLPSFKGRPVDVFKMVGVGVLVIILLAFVVRIISTSLSSIWPMNRVGMGGASVSSYTYDAAQSAPSAMGKAYGGAAELSVRNIAPMPPVALGATGNTAEEFEVKNYYGMIETRDLKSTCAKIVSWKADSYVIFEHANESERTCNYTFKVEKSRVSEVLARVKELGPKDLTENVQTIKRTIDDFTSEVEILEKKRDSIEKTLESAIRAYDEITGLATRNQDVASLAKIIESKIQIIERLTQERININEQLDRLQRAKADQLDRVDYTYFSLNVYENKFVDGEQLKDSWKEAVREFVRDLNKIVQDLTIHLLTLFLLVIQYVLYFCLLLVIAKYVWQFAKAVWKR